MATLHLILLPNYINKPKSLLLTRPRFRLTTLICRRPSTTAVSAFKVVIEHDGETTKLEVDLDETIIYKVLEVGLGVPHECKLGVCMTCPARLVSGKVNQSKGMLSINVVDRGYALTCASYPRLDGRIKIIPEDELLSLQLATTND